MFVGAAEDVSGVIRVFLAVVLGCSLAWPSRGVLDGVPSVFVGEGVVVGVAVRVFVAVGVFDGVAVGVLVDTSGVFVGVAFSSLTMVICASSHEENGIGWPSSSASSQSWFRSISKMAPSLFSSKTA